MACFLFWRSSPMNVDNESSIWGQERSYINFWFFSPFLKDFWRCLNFLVLLSQIHTELLKTSGLFILVGSQARCLKWTRLQQRHVSGCWRFQGHPKTVPFSLSTSGGSKVLISWLDSSLHSSSYGFSPTALCVFPPSYRFLIHWVGDRGSIQCDFVLTDYIKARPYFSYDHILRVRVRVAWGRMIPSHWRRNAN